MERNRDGDGIGVQILLVTTEKGTERKKKELSIRSWLVWVSLVEFLDEFLRVF